MKIINNLIYMYRENPDGLRNVNDNRYSVNFVFLKLIFKLTYELMLSLEALNV